MIRSSHELRCHRLRDGLAASLAWLQRTLDAPGTEASLGETSAMLEAACTLASAGVVGARNQALRERLRREQRADGGFSAAPGSAVSDLTTTALCVELLAAESGRSASSEESLRRAAVRLANAEARPAVVRALVALVRAGIDRGVVDDLSRATKVLEDEFETHALQPLDSVHDAAERVHAWHRAASVVGLEGRRHPAVHACTLALVQRTEASAGEIAEGYTKDGRGAGRRADTLTAARVARALFAVKDAVVGPRAEFAAQLVVDALASRVEDGAAQARGSRSAPRTLAATALYVQVLQLAIERTAIPWTLPRPDRVPGADESSRFARGA